MHGGSVVVIYGCDVPSFDEIRRNSPSVSKKILDFGSLMVIDAWVHGYSFPCVSTSSLQLDDCNSSPCLFAWFLAYSLFGWPWSKYFVWTACCSSVSSIMSTGFFLLVILVRAFCFEPWQGAGAWFLIPAWWTTSKSSSSSRNRHVANLCWASADFMNRYRASWPVGWIKQLGLRYAHSNNITLTIARLSFFYSFQLLLPTGECVRIVSHWSGSAIFLIPGSTYLI